MLQSNIKTEVIPEDETEIILKSLDFLDIKFDSVTGKAYINNRLYPALVKIGTIPFYNSNGMFCASESGQSMANSWFFTQLGNENRKVVPITDLVYSLKKRISVQKKASCSEIDYQYQALRKLMVLIIDAKQKS